MSKRSEFLSNLRNAAKDAKKKTEKPCSRKYQQRRNNCGVLADQQPSKAQPQKHAQTLAPESFDSESDAACLESPCPTLNSSSDLDSVSYNNFCDTIFQEDAIGYLKIPNQDEGLTIPIHAASSPVTSPGTHHQSSKNERREDVKRTLLFSEEPPKAASSNDPQPDINLSNADIVLDPECIFGSIPTGVVVSIPVSDATEIDPLPLSVLDAGPSVSDDFNNSPHGIPLATEEELHLSSAGTVNGSEFSSVVGSTAETSEEHSSGSARRREYTAPEKLTRKRSTDKSKWKKKLAKGEEHVSLSGAVRRGRNLQPGCDLSCRKKCAEKVSESERQEIFDQFWKIKTQKEKWDFIALHVEQVNKTETSEDLQPEESATEPVPKKERKATRKYHFRLHGNKVQVCKTMFLDTLDVCDSLIETTFKKLKQGGYISPDKRHGHGNKNKTGLDAMKNTVREHINLLPRMPSHYSRARSSKEYLVQEFQSCADMHGQYLVWMATVHSKEKAASLRQYREIFNTEFNICFFIPKKDGCDECTAWENTPEDQRPAIEAKYKQHLENKDLVTGMKDADTIVSHLKESKDLVVAHFDFEKNLICPKASSSVFYYRRKLCVSNFTIVDVGRYEDYCYVYDETIGRKGSNVVASFVLHFIEVKVKAGIREFRFYSDNCGGQNKNRNVAALFVYASARFNVKITHKYFGKRAYLQ